MIACTLRRVANGYLLITKDNIDKFCDKRLQINLVIPGAIGTKAVSPSSALRKVLYARWSSSNKDRDFDEFYLDEMELIINDQVGYLE